MYKLKLIPRETISFIEDFYNNIQFYGCNMISELEIYCKTKIKNKQCYEDNLIKLKQYIYEYLKYDTINPKIDLTDNSKFNLMIEATNIIVNGDTNHPIPDMHVDSDEYGPCITFLFYIQKDDTIINGNLEIYDKTNDRYDYTLTEIIDVTTNDNLIKLVILDNNIAHKVQNISGYGIRNVLLCFVSIK